MPDRYREAAAVFLEALERPAAERADFVEEACAGDPSLVRRVIALLEADASAPRLLDSGPEALAGMLAPPPNAPLAGRRIGPYALLEEIGRGGMGAVFLAEREDVGKRVALKLVTGGLAAPGRVERFLIERRVLARLEHPGIARLLDAGVEADGTPWFAMEYVAGRRVDEYVTDHRLTVRQRLALFEQICDAVAYAHRNLVVHRDLKPSNILVTESGEARLLDFGIAKLLQDETAEDVTTGWHPMTPEYASPEQLRGDPVTTLSDVYQLGVLLYELLADCRPGRAEGRSAGDRERAIIEGRVPKPSQVAPAEIRRQVAGDLDNVVSMAMRPEPERRYPSAQQLAEDVRRHLDGLPVRARPGTIGYRAVRFVGRHRAATATAVATLLGVVGFALAMAGQARRAARQQARAERVTSLLTDLFASADPTVTKGDTVTVRAVLDRGAEEVRRAAADDPEVAARILDVIGVAYRNLGRLDRAIQIGTEAVASLRGRVDPDHPLVLRALENLGRWRAEAGEGAGALATLEEALVLARRLGPGRRAELAGLLNAKGYAHQVAGRHAEAHARYDEALAIIRTLPAGADHDVEPVLVNLGWLAEARGDPAAAAGYFREVLDRRRLRLGADHSSTMRTMVALARPLLDLDSIDVADRLVREALAGQRRTFADPHPDLAETLSLGAQILARRGRPGDAEAPQREALAVYRQAYGDRNVATAQALTNLAGLLRVQGRLDEAATLTREAAERYRELLGAGHVSTAVTVGNLAYLEYLRRRLPAAESLYREAVPVLDSAWHGSARVAPTLVDFGVVLAEQRKLLEAEPRFRRALELERGRRPEGHVDVIRPQRYLGNTLVALGRFEEAEPLLRDAHRRLVVGWGDANQYTVAAAGDLVRLYERWGKPALAETFRSR